MKTETVYYECDIPKAKNFHNFGIFSIAYFQKKLSCNIIGNFSILIEHVLVDVLWRNTAK